MKKNIFKDCFEKGKKYFCKFFLQRKNLERDIFSIFCIIFVSWLVVAVNIPKKSEYIPHVPVVEEPQAETVALPSDDEKIAAVQSEANFDGWKDYKSEWYGFEIKYPGNWKVPIVKKAAHGSKWAQKYEFRKAGTEANGSFIGYDILVYDLKKIKNAEDTEEFVKKNGEDFLEESSCWQITGHLLENENFPAERVYIPSGDICYQPILFYNLVRDEYIYNLVPILEKNAQTSSDLRSDLLENFPEFFSAASTFNLIKIKKPKVVPAKPRITAPMPYIYDKDSQGRRVCNRKNDHPSKSDKNKKKHLDMECCLDPDEYPNPNCYYPPSKYGKYLK